ncbi:MAG: hypothetical protein ABJA78_02225 [Ferruginibacter sp.]
MKLKIPLAILLLTGSMHVHSQVAVNTSGATADTSAILDVKSSIKGMLIPRMTQTEMGNIPGPATGLLVYQTSPNPGIYYNSGTPAVPGWVVLQSSATGGWQTNGTALYYNSGNIGIGISSPSKAIHIFQSLPTQVGLQIDNTSTDPASGEGISFKDETAAFAGLMTTDAASATGAALLLYNNRTGGQLRFNTAGVTRMYIANNGTVGIGTNFTTPQSILHVKGVEWGTNSVLLENTSPSIVGPTLSFKGPGGQYDIIGSTGSGASTGTGYFGIWDNTGSQYRFVIAPGGNIGIGTVSPLSSAKLHLESSLSYTLYVKNNTTNTSNWGIYSSCLNGPGFGIGIRAEGSYTGVAGEADGGNYTGTIYGVSGTAQKNVASGTAYGIYGLAFGAATNYAGYFAGNVHVNGTLSKSAGTFKIDHPQDPENKYLVHSFVESPDMMNVYNGNIITGSDGKATVTLPTYFEAENIDFKYQLTVIGQFAQAIVAKEIAQNSFIIETSKPNVKVSWMVTGVRNDRFAQRNRVVPEVAKLPEDRGKYLNPDVYDLPAERAINPAPKAGKH